MCHLAWYNLSWAMTRRDNRVTQCDKTGKTSATGGDSHQVGELRGMLQTLERLGYDLDSLLTSVGMQRGDVENSTAYISPRACSMVFARANEEGRVPNLPLQLAIHTPIGSNPLLDYLIVSSASVEQGLERLSRYLRIVNPAIRIIVQNRRDTARVVVESAPGPFEMELCVSLSLLRFARETDGRMKPAYACSDVRFARVLHGMGGPCQSLQCGYHSVEGIPRWDAGLKAKPQKSSRVSQKTAMYERKLSAF